MKDIINKLFPITMFIRNSIKEKNKQIDEIFKQAQALIDNCDNDATLKQDLKILYDDINELNKQIGILWLARYGNLCSILMWLVSIMLSIKFIKDIFS